jgi:hypothetical protein
MKTKDIVLLGANFFTIVMSALIMTLSGLDNRPILFVIGFCDFISAVFLATVKANTLFDTN